MKNTKSAKIITLIIVILLIAGAAAGIHVLSNRNTENAENEAATETAGIQQNTESDPATETGGEQTAFTEDSLILVEGGTFTMGSPADERQRQEDEVSHEVTVSSFYVDPYEVRQSDYERIMGENPSYFS